MVQHGQTVERFPLDPLGALAESPIRRFECDCAQASDVQCYRCREAGAQRGTVTNTGSGSRAQGRAGVVGRSETDDDELE